MYVSGGLDRLESGDDPVRRVRRPGDAATNNDNNTITTNDNNNNYYNY